MQASAIEAQYPSLTRTDPGYIADKATWLRKAGRVGEARALLAGPRILYRLFKDRSVDAVLARDGQRRVPVLLVGASDAAALFIQATRQRPAEGYRAVGILDDKGSRVGRAIGGVRILGTIDQADEIAARIAELERERFNLTFRAGTQPLDDPLRLRVIRRDIARLKTVQRAKRPSGGK